VIQVRICCLWQVISTAIQSVVALVLVLVLVVLVLVVLVLVVLVLVLVLLVVLVLVLVLLVLLLVLVLVLVLLVLLLQLFALTGGVVQGTLHRLVLKNVMDEDASFPLMVLLENIGTFAAIPAWLQVYKLLFCQLLQ